MAILVGQLTRIRTVVVRLSQNGMIPESGGHLPLCTQIASRFVLPSEKKQPIEATTVAKRSKIVLLEYVMPAL
jgi:hypothetical protein